MSFLKKCFTIESRRLLFLHDHTQNFKTVCGHSFQDKKIVKKNLLIKEKLTISTPNHHRCLPFCKLEVNLNESFIHLEGWLRGRIRPEDDARWKKRIVTVC